VCSRLHALPLEGFEGAGTARVDLAVEFSGVGRIEAIDLNRTANNLEHLAQGPNSTANVRGAAAKHSESQKHNHYARLIENYAAKRALFVPAVVEAMGRIGEDYDKFITRVAAFAHAPLGDVTHDVDGLRSRLVSQMRQQIAVGNVIGNHAMIEAWRANSWVAPSGEDASDAVSEAEPSPQGPGGAGGGSAA
jgi:hypothetical protein